MSVDSVKPVLWTAEEAAAATGGRVKGGWQATGVSIDSRTVAPGDLFVALRGPNFDGHGFVSAALAAGAAAALVAEPPTEVAGDARLLTVADTFLAMEALGRAARRRTTARVMAVTGSVGKTGTKEALLACLSAQAPTTATLGSLNNHWGVPLSLARLPADCRFGVFELGMNHAGEIGPLSQQVRPEVGLITTIAPAHMEFFASLEAVADAKAELFEGMEAGGVAILNRDNDQYQRLRQAAISRGLRVRDFGGASQADARVTACSDIVTAGLATGSMVSAEIDGVRLDYRLSVPGRHLVVNSLGVLLTVQALGGSVENAAHTLGVLNPVKGRGTRRSVRLGADGAGAFTLIDESYNASPAAMAAAFQVLGAAVPEAGARRLAVLGDMRELGECADAFHADLAEPLNAAGIDAVFCCGPHMRALFERLPEARRGGHTIDSAALAPMLAERVRAGDVVLVKGSAGSRMNAVVAALAALDCAGADGHTEFHQPAARAAVAC